MKTSGVLTLSRTGFSSPVSWRRLLPAVLLLAVALPTSSSLGAEEPSPRPQEEATDLFERLQLRHIGPVGNRVTAVSGVAGDPSVYYAGAASGGVFRSQDGGIHWEAIFDDTGAFSIGSIAVAPSDANVVWVGTGETFIRSNATLGDGMYRSTDGGDSWHRRGLIKSGRIGRVIVHPNDPDTVFAAALGHSYGPQKERGIYRTTDGGKTWEQVLFVDENSGGIDLAMDPNNPRILFAATWQFVMSTYGRTSGGPGSGLFRSLDGGDTWQRLTGGGLPSEPWGKIGLAMTAANSHRVYALIETSSNQQFAPFEDFQGVLWRSDDRGDSWEMVNADNNLTQRPLYYTRGVASPHDADEITFMAVDQLISKDGGKTTEPQNSGWDHHDLWIDPEDPKRRVSGHDGGVSITTNSGKSWSRPLLPNAQMYHVATDTRIPYRVYGNRQDGPTAAGPSNSLTGSTIPIGAWREVGGCEVGFSLPDPDDPNIVWSGCYDGILERFDWRTGHARDVSVWPLAIESWAAEDLRYRIQWTAPVALSPHDSKTVYYGSQYVHRTTSDGQSWKVISPDLTLADPEWMKRSGGLTLDDAGPTIAPVVFAIAESPISAGEIWAGTNDGLVHLSRDGGENWTDVTKNIQGLPERGTVTIIEPSRHEAGRAYVVVDRHQLGDTEPYLFRTEDFGQTWTSVRGDLPSGVYGFAHCLREDPVVPGLLYVGTESRLWVSLDDGQRWQPLGSALPPTPVHWLEVQEHFGDLAVATYGRGFWILDDLSPVRALARSNGSEPSLLAPRSAYRFRRQSPSWSEEYSAASGTNPEYGATLHYFLPDAVSGDLSLRVRDGSGELVRVLENLSTEPGLHRLVWDLRGEQTPEVKLRTRPAENEKISLPTTGWRRLRDGGEVSLLQAPGRYRLELVAEDGVISEQQLTVLKDPNSSGSLEDLVSQLEVARTIYAQIKESAEMINSIEWLRRQIDEFNNRQSEERATMADLEELGQAWTGPVHEAVDAFSKSLDELEDQFFDRRLTGARQDSLRWQRRLYARFSYLLWRLSKTDDRPTDQHLELHQELSAELDELRGRYQELVDEELAALNRIASESGFGLLGLVEPVERAEVSNTQASPDA